MEKRKTKKKRRNPLSVLVYRFLRLMVKIIYPRISVENTENIPDEPCVIVGNHTQMNGPIISELYIPGDRAIWCEGQMMKLREVPAYAYQDFWSGKPKCSQWFYKLLSYIIAPIAVCVFNNAHTIAVYRDVRILSTFRQTTARLGEGANIVIFPEKAEPYNNIINEFQDRFIDVARFYFKKTGKKLPFVPMYFAPKLKSVYAGKSIVFDPEAPIEEERRRICDYLMAQITDMAVALPEHIVIPYGNIAKKDYTTNTLMK